jgi:hypothetical protein
MKIVLVYDPKVDVMITVRAGDEAAAEAAKIGLQEALQRQIEELCPIRLKGPNGESVHLQLEIEALGEPQVDDVEEWD